MEFTQAQLEIIRESVSCRAESYQERAHIDDGGNVVPGSETLAILGHVDDCQKIVDMIKEQAKGE